MTMWKKTNTSTLLVGMKVSIASMENIMKVLEKI
jgi:hypothetical protein